MIRGFPVRVRGRLVGVVEMKCELIGGPCDGMTSTGPHGPALDSEPLCVYSEQSKRSFWYEPADADQKRAFGGYGAPPVMQGTETT